MIAEYNNNTYIANLRDAHIVLMTYQKEKATEGFSQKRNYYKKKININDEGLTDLYDIHFYIQYTDIEEGYRRWLVDEDRAIGINGNISNNEVIIDVDHDSKHKSWIQYEKGAAAKKIKLNDCKCFIIEKSYVKQDGKNTIKTEKTQVELNVFKYMIVSLRRANL